MSTIINCRWSVVFSCILYIHLPENGKILESSGLDVLQRIGAYFERRETSWQVHVKDPMDFIVGHGAEGDFNANNTCQVSEGRLQKSGGKV